MFEVRSIDVIDEYIQNVQHEIAALEASSDQLVTRMAKMLKDGKGDDSKLTDKHISLMTKIAARQLYLEYLQKERYEAVKKLVVENNDSALDKLAAAVDEQRAAEIAYQKALEEERASRVHLKKVKAKLARTKKKLWAFDFGPAVSAGYDKATIEQMREELDPVLKWRNERAGIVADA